MALNTDHLDQGIKTLDLSLKLLSEQTPNTAEYHVMRSAVIKEFGYSPVGQWYEV